MPARSHRSAPRAVTRPAPPAARRRRPAAAKSASATRRPADHDFGPKLRLAANDRRSQILAAALQVFAEHGFHGTRTRELAKRAGVSEALVFRHFPTKDALIAAILDVVGLESHIEAMEERFKDMPPRQALVSIAAHILTNLKEQPHVFRVVFFGVLEAPHMATEFYRRFLSRILALETRLFERAFAERA